MERKCIVGEICDKMDVIDTASEPDNALNYVILEHVFVFLKRKDLLYCRLVSRQWHDIGTWFLKKKIDEVKIEFRLDEGRMAEFVKISKSCAFKFTNFSFTDLSMSAVQTEKLLNELGSSVTKLSLCYDQTKNEISAAEITDILTTKTPSLRELHIVMLPPNVQDNPIFPSTKVFPELKIERIKLECIYGIPFLKDLFKSCKSLKALRFMDWYPGGLILPLLHGSLQQFQDLEILNPRPETITLLSTVLKSAPMVRFSARTYHYTGQSLVDLIQFIDDHKENWINLELTFLLLGDTFILPVLNSLKYLVLEHCYTNCLQLMKALDYNKQFPNLVTLKLKEQNRSMFLFGGHLYFNFDVLFPVGATPLLSLKNLELPSFLTANVLLRIGETFPNVVNVVMSRQTKETLPSLWTSWPLLESLEVIIQTQ